MINVPSTRVQIIRFSIYASFFLGGFVFVNPFEAGAQASEDALWQRHEQRQAEQHETDRALLTWGTASLVGGGLFIITDISDFGWMTAGWGVVHTAFAAHALLNPASFNRNSHDVADLLKHEQRINRRAAIKTGLNAGYAAVGLGMARYSDSRRITEYGSAIFAQGAFLLVYHSVELFLSSRYLNDITVYPAFFSTIYPDQAHVDAGGLTFQIQF